MKTLYLMRHGKSDWGNPALSDYDRPLNERGIRASSTIARYIKDSLPLPDIVLCSPAVRAEQTLRFLEGTWRCAVETLWLENLYLAAPAGMLKLIRAHAPDNKNVVMVIGHNPGMEQLAGQLASPDSDPGAMVSLRSKYPTAALAVFEWPESDWEDVAPGTGKLTRFVKPRDLD